MGMAVNLQGREHPDDTFGMHEERGEDSRLEGKIQRAKSVPSLSFGMVSSFMLLPYLPRSRSSFLQRGEDSVSPFSLREPKLRRKMVSFQQEERMAKTKRWQLTWAGKLRARMWIHQAAELALPRNTFCAIPLPRVDIFSQAGVLGGSRRYTPLGGAPGRVPGTAFTCSPTTLCSNNVRTPLAVRRTITDGRHPLAQSSNPLCRVRHVNVIHNPYFDSKYRQPEKHEAGFGNFVPTQFLRCGAKARSVYSGVLHERGGYSRHERQVLSYWTSTEMPPAG